MIDKFGLFLDVKASIYLYFLKISVVNIQRGKVGRITWISEKEGTSVISKPLRVRDKTELKMT